MLDNSEITSFYDKIVSKKKSVEDRIDKIIIYPKPIIEKERIIFYKKNVLPFLELLNRDYKDFVSYIGKKISCRSDQTEDALFFKCKIFEESLTRLLQNYVDECRCKFCKSIETRISGEDKEKTKECLACGHIITIKI